VAADAFVRPHFIPTTTFKEIEMKTLYALTLAALLGIISPAASADDASAANPQSARTRTTALTPAAPARVSQQDKMRQCAKQATGKKGAERKAFMKTCLSKKKA
jgi:psiF repeat-containing protein